MSIINEIKTFGRFESIYPEKSEALKTKILEEKIPKTNLRWIDAMTAAEDDPNLLKSISKNFRESYKKGGNSFFSPSIGKRMALHDLKSISSFGLSAGVKTLGGLNTVSNKLLGTGLVGLGFGAALFGAAGYGLSRATGVSARDAGTAMNQMMRESDRPKYGRSEIGQSTTYLVQGLNNRRVSR